jgi:hypothetical protein
MNSEVKLRVKKLITSNAAWRLVQLALAQQEQVQKGEQPSVLSWCEPVFALATTGWLFPTFKKFPSSIQGKALCIRTIRDIMNAKNFIIYKNRDLPGKIASCQPAKISLWLQIV